MVSPAKRAVWPYGCAALPCWSACLSVGTIRKAIRLGSKSSVEPRVARLAHHIYEGLRRVTYIYNTLGRAQMGPDR